GLARADVIVITRVEQAGDISNLKFEISNTAPDASVFECRTVLSGLRPVADGSRDSGNRLRTKPKRSDKVFAFCGLGSPANFFELLRQNGIDPVGTRAFADHHVYASHDVAGIERAAIDAGAD